MSVRLDAMMAARDIGVSVVAVSVVEEVVVAVAVVVVVAVAVVVVGLNSMPSLASSTSERVRE